MKSLKKIMAGAMAVVMTATITSLGISASTYYEEPLEHYTWRTTYSCQSYTGSYTGIKDECVMKYSPDGYQIALKSMSCKMAGTSGTITATTISPEVDKFSTKLYDVGDVRIFKVHPNDPLSGVKFQFSADINPTGNSVEAGGDIDCIKKSS